MNPAKQMQANFKTGVVSAIDPDDVKARVVFADLDGLETAFIPVGQRKTLADKDYWMPDVGEHVACLMDANAEDGVILCAIYSGADAGPVNNADKRHVRFKDGAAFEYDRASHELTIKGGIERVVVETGAEIVLKAGGTVRIEAEDTVIPGNLTVGGDITAGGSIMDAGGNSNHHSH